MQIKQIIVIIWLFQLMMTYQQQKQINFSGYTWILKDSSGGKVGPGPNYFDSSDKSVWIDPSGHLHLTIRNQNSKWYCSELVLKNQLGYGTYSLTTSSNVQSIDINSILGIFTYESDEQQIDIQWSRWGNAANQNCQFVIQPPIKESLFRQKVQLQGADSLNRFKWTEKLVTFEVGKTISGKEQILMSWQAKNPPANIPKAGNERFRINFWLMKGLSPIDGKNMEVIIKHFSFKAA